VANEHDAHSGDQLALVDLAADLLRGQELRRASKQ
jgi:hypothetical protein